MYELPPILQGSEREQLVAIRDYLVRMANNLGTQVEHVVETTAEKTGSIKQTAAEAAQDQATRLKSLIIKTANTIQHNIDIITTELHEDYLALSDFGAYQEEVNTTIEETARGITESFNAQSLLLSGRLDDQEAAMTSIRGEIRRGLITDPETGETAIGIAIAENLQFTGTEHTEGGLVYYELSPGQTIGLYTSTGWQFWINGSKRGWYDSRDGMLHIAKLAVESEMRVGGDWLITTVNGYGLRYVGG